MTIEEILKLGTPQQIIAALKEKSINVPAWGGRNGLQQEYDPKRHPVMNRAQYPDVVNEDGTLTPSTRITFDLQRLATKRMTELITGIPVKRVYRPENPRQQEAAAVIEKIYQRARIDALNIERCNMLFAACEFMTLWYAVLDANTLYGVKSDLKIRCRNFSPMQGDELYPLFDEDGDLIALSVAYTRKVAARTVSFFDAYTADRHLKFSNENGWSIIEDEPIALGKIPAVYCHRPTPVWEDTSRIVYEMEWAMSRNGNYLRENSKPLFVVFADDAITYGDEAADDPTLSKGKAVMQFPKGSSASYITWQQAVDNLKFYVSELRNAFFTQLQLPDWSYEKMSQQALSGESRKQLFIDAQLKVKDESGRLLECFEREVNVVKALAKRILPEHYAADIDALPVEVEITTFTINDEKETIERLLLANGNNPLMSQRESIEALGWSDDVEQTMREIADERKFDAFEPTV